MAENTKIEWADHTASPWHGCSKVHTGCENCYAEALAKRNPGSLGIWGDEGTRVKSKNFIRNLRKWDKEARKQGRIASVFPSLCDPFEDRPELEPWRREMFEAIDQCQSLRLLLLTKRPQNVRGMWSGVCHDTDMGGNGVTMTAYRRNVHLLYSASDQPSLDAGIDHLLACRPLVPVLGLSLEPLTGPIDFRIWDDDRDSLLDHIDWVIVGGESGPNARPMHPDWVRSIHDQCVAAGVPFFFKQWGEWAPAHHCWSCQADGETVLAELMSLRRRCELAFGGDCSEVALWKHRNSVMARVGKKKAGRLLDGRTWDELPEVDA